MPRYYSYLVSRYLSKLSIVPDPCFDLTSPRPRKCRMAEPIRLLMTRTSRLRMSGCDTVDGSHPRASRYATLRMLLNNGESPFLAKSGHPTALNRSPLYPQQRTFRGPRWTSAFDPKATFVTLALVRRNANRQSEQVQGISVKPCSMNEPADYSGKPAFRNLLPSASARLDRCMAPC